MYPSMSNPARPGSYSFRDLPSLSQPRSVFRRSKGCTTTFDAGLLIPFWVDEVLPGDSYRVSPKMMVRMTTPIKPLFDSMSMDLFFFYVPLRLIWDNFKKFMGEQINPGDSTNFLVPSFTPYIPGVESLSDYIGIPTSNPAMAAITHRACWHRAYQLIWDTFFRDENLQNSVFESRVGARGDGPDAIADYGLLRRGKRHDYYTSCLPFPQKGSPVLLPLGSVAPVIQNTAAPVPTFLSHPANAALGAGQMLAGQTDLEVVTGNVTGAAVSWKFNNSGLVADLANAAAVTINQVREAVAIQELLERDARGGTRYVELLLSHWGIHAADRSLQRPEYLGGGSIPVNVHPVASTDAFSGTTFGNLGAFALAAGNGNGFFKSFEEHGVLLGLVSVRAELRYQQGLERMFSRSDRYDFAWPELMHLGEQEVLSKEIYCDGSAGDATTFGYQERFAEYRYGCSIITGKMRSQAPTSLDVWHLAQEFSARPLLNATFIQDDPPIDRAILIPSEPHFFGDFWCDVQCARLMPTYSVPALGSRL